MLQGPGGGFEVSTGIPSPPPSPALKTASATAAQDIPTTRPGLKARGSSGSIGSKSSTASSSGSSGAAYTIAEECERLFCGTLEAVFLGEGNTTVQDPLAMGMRFTQAAHNTDLARPDVGVRMDSVVLGPTGLPTPSPSPHGVLGLSMHPDAHPQPKEMHRQVQKPGAVTDWLEIWDYSGGLRFRGFVAAKDGVRSLFVFFDNEVIGKDLKQGLMALLELAGNDDFGCGRLVVCVDRTGQDEDVKDLTRDLGWVGFDLVTLDPWSHGKACTSERWVFLSMDV